MQLLGYLKGAISTLTVRRAISRESIRYNSGLLGVTKIAVEPPIALQYFSSIAS